MDADRGELLLGLFVCKYDDMDVSVNVDGIYNTRGNL